MKKSIVGILLLGSIILLSGNSLASKVNNEGAKKEIILSVVKKGTGNKFENLLETIEAYKEDSEIKVAFDDSHVGTTVMLVVKDGDGEVVSQTFYTVLSGDKEVSIQANDVEEFAGYKLEIVTLDAELEGDI